MSIVLLAIHFSFTEQKSQNNVRSIFTMAGSQQDDGDFQSIPTKKQSIKKRLYIGNLPVQSEDLEDKLVELLKETADCQVDRQQVQVIRSKSCHALVSVSTNIDAVIRKLHRTHFEGKRLVVQRERKPRKEYDPDTPNAFTKTWAKPKTRPQRGGAAAVTEEPIMVVPDPPVNIQDASERVGAIVAGEMTRAMENGEQDAMNAAIASTAAVTLLAATGFGIESEGEAVADPGDEQPADEAEDVDAVDEEDFMARCKQPMSSLLSEYGVFDPKWTQVQPTNMDTPELEPTKDIPTNTDSEPKPESVLGMHGKMPIHVEFTSFGYHHGAPSVGGKGWSHSQPLAPFDCRDLAEVPTYLAWRDGLSGAVKRALMYAQDETTPDIRDYARGVAAEVAVALSEAIDEGGYGYAMPLRMVVYVGSESGRHRSVVACELAATALRKLLRANKDYRFSQPCSVGTKHRQVQRRKRRNPHARTTKQNALEEGWK